MLVDPAAGTREPAFDHTRLAVALASSTSSWPGPDDHLVVLRMMADRRDELGAARTAVVSGPPSQKSLDIRVWQKTYTGISSTPEARLCRSYVPDAQWLSQWLPEPAHTGRGCWRVIPLAYAAGPSVPWQRRSVRRGRQCRSDVGPRR
jgi:hypothetical protein